MKIVTVQEMQFLEQQCANFGVTTDSLMERASFAVANQAQTMLGSKIYDNPVVILAGKGNNGSDGLRTAWHLNQWGRKVMIYLPVPRNIDDPEMARIKNEGIYVLNHAEDPDLKEIKSFLAKTPLVIDALLGIGHNRSLDGSIRSAMLAVGEARIQRKSTSRLLAVDVPTGFNADTGQIDPAFTGADHTIALGLPKVGFYCFPGAARLGTVTTADIGIPKELLAKINLEVLEPEMIGDLLPARPMDAHKGQFGKTLIIAGSRTYVGAAALAAFGAARVGVGLVTIGTPRTIYPIVAGHIVEATHLPLAETRSGTIAPSAATAVASHLPNFQSLLVGCGLGQNLSTRQFIARLLLKSPLPVPAVIDADGLNNLADCAKWWKHLHGSVVLTPHVKEMERLTGRSISQIKADHIQITRQEAARWGQVVILKGAFTTITGPNGYTWISPFANPGLASAGTGDILSGMVSGLLAQGLSPMDAARCAVYLHGEAGQQTQQDMGSTGMLASDILRAIPKAIMKIRAEN